MTTENYTKTEAISIPSGDIFEEVITLIKENEFKIILSVLSLVSAISFFFFYFNGLGLAYNDARSHLDIGRRVVENIKPGLAQIGSVWLPLPHFLMLFTVWNNFMWHSGLSGALTSMISYIGSGLFIWLILKKLNMNLVSRLVGVFAFAANANILYLQSTAMTELLFIFTFCAAFYELLCWYKSDKAWDLVKAAFWIMLSTLTRYDAWFIFMVITGLVTTTSFFKKGFKAAEGTFLLFATLGGLGIFLWFAWNYLIFGDPLFSFFGPYSAYAQQKQIYDAGELITKWNIVNSIKIYGLTLYYTIGLFNLIMAVLGMILLFLDRSINKIIKLAMVTILLSPLIYNILALFFGHSIISIVHVFGDNWFNVRYGVVMLPTVAILIGYFIQKINNPMRYLLIPALFFAYFSSYFTSIPVTIQDALWGASSKNVSQVSGWLRKNAASNQDKIYIAAGSHDAIIFTSGYNMERFIHEGTGQYFKLAGSDPTHWVRYIVMRTYDMQDATYYALKDTPDFSKYNLVLKGEFADIYEIKSEYSSNLPSYESFKTTNLNSKTQNNKYISGQTLQSNKSANINTLELTSMFGVVSTALFMTRLKGPVKIQTKKKEKEFGEINSELGYNLVTMKNIKNTGILESEPK